MKKLCYHLLIQNVICSIVSDKRGDLTAISLDESNENPKLTYLKNEILGYFRDNKDSCGIVFAKTREMTVALMNWMQETPELNKLNPHNLVGSNAPSQKAGMLADMCALCTFCLVQ